MQRCIWHSDETNSKNIIEERTIGIHGWNYQAMKFYSLVFCAQINSNVFR